MPPITFLSSIGRVTRREAPEWVICTRTPDPAPRARNALRFASVTDSQVGQPRRPQVGVGVLVVREEYRAARSSTRLARGGDLEPAWRPPRVR